MHIVIKTRDRRELLERTIVSIAEARRPSRFGSLIVVENGGGSVARDVCERLSERLPIEYIHAPQAGVALSLQTALEFVGRGPVVFLDDDIRVNPEFLEAYDQAMDDNGPGHVYGGPVLIDYEAEPPPEWLMEHLPLSATGFDGKSQPVFLGANFGLFAQDALAAGGFDTSLGAGADNQTGIALVGEESDLQRRLFSAGFGRVLVEDARIWHWVPAERCSPRWALQRLARNAATRAWQSHSLTSGPRFFGAPRWMWRRLLGTALGRAFAVFQRDPDARFQAHAEFHKARAEIRAFRARAKRQSPPGS